MKLATAPDKARALKPGQHAQAAHLYNSVEHELELGNYTEEESDRADEALRHLDEHFPGVRQAAHSTTRPPALSHSAQRTVHGPRPSSKTSRPRGAGGGPRPSSRASRPRAGGLRFGGTRTRRRFAQTGIPAGAESTAQLVMRSIGGLVGLSLVYLLVTPKGSRAIELAGGGLTHGVQALISPNADPLQPATRPGASRAAPRGNPANQPADLTRRAVAGTTAAVTGEINAIARSIATGAHKPKAGGTHP